MKVNKLRGIIVENGMTQEEVAKKLNISPKTFYLKMKKGIFDTDEAAALTELLSIDNPIDIFFAKEVT